MITLAPSLINLDSYVFIQLVANTNLAFEESKLERKLLIDDLEVHIENQEIDDNNVSIVSMAVRTKPETESNLPCHFSIEVVAKFALDEKLVVDISTGNVNALTFLKLSTMNLLYGIIRDQLFTMTAKLYRGALFLPSCTFSLTIDSGENANPSE